MFFLQHMVTRADKEKSLPAFNIQGKGGKSMDETGIAVKLEAHEHEIGSLKHRVRELEGEAKVINDLAISINKMAVNMENMLVELKRHSERLEILEKVPLETNKQVKAAIITALVGGIVGAVLTAILTIL